MPSDGAIANYDDLFDAVMAKKGWFLDFPDSKERNLGQASLFGEILSFTTYIPSLDPCQYEGETYLYAVDYLTGTAYYDSVIGTDASDTNAEGEELVRKRISLGRGLSITPNIHTGREEGSKVFVQTSTGAIEVVSEANPGITKSEKLSWEEED